MSFLIFCLLDLCISDREVLECLTMAVDLFFSAFSFIRFLPHIIRHSFVRQIYIKAKLSFSVFIPFIFNVIIDMLTLPFQFLFSLCFVFHSWCFFSCLTISYLVFCFFFLEFHSIYIYFPCFEHIPFLHSSHCSDHLLLLLICYSLQTILGIYK